MLCNNVQNCFILTDNSIFELMELKDKLLFENLPRNVLLRITLVLSRFFRIYSQTQISIYELIHLVQLNSDSFQMKYILLKRLYDSNETKTNMFDIALKKIISMEDNLEHYEQQKCIDNWEKMYIHLALPKSNIRKWKFQIETFREKAILGYEHVIEWLHTGVSRVASAAEIPCIEESIKDDDIDQEEIFIQEIDDDERPQTNHGSDYGEEDGSFLSSAGTHNTEKIQQEPMVITSDIELQIQPDLDDQQTSTEDIFSTKSLILRIYRPIGIFKSKFQCIVYAQGQKYVTKEFNFNISNSLTNENTKSRGRLTGSRMRFSETSIVSNDIDIHTIDKQQNDEFLLPFSNIRLPFQNNMDSNAIKIDILGDNELFGSLILSSEDLRMLDLPILNSQTSSPLITVDDNTSIKSTSYVFDQSSNEIYRSWMSHTPQTFPIYNDEDESIARLPLIMFWYNKIENTHATKCTMTNQILGIQTYLKIPTVTNNKQNRSKPINNNIEILKATYENEIDKIHEKYQAKIDRLKKLINANLAYQSDENVSNIVQEGGGLRINIRRQQHPKPEVITKHEEILLSRKNSPKNFLERNQMYSQQSLIHRHQLTAKIERETALANERQLKVQHRLNSSHQNNAYDDLCLPAVFMPTHSGHVFNPRAYQYFHPIGTTDSRLTQPPSIFNVPLQASRSISVLNLFELTRSYGIDNNEKDRILD
ncbi:unnamed protein product [Adineta steineri]|uniref:Uncharacterized protein n=1 Tax=Adineta steineri TaxID=433720 RepID=A0A814D306_9BILA|nr:unnamed protein product [Adineta steineri]CAF1417809.1 unnamed protein product [Adineta steineri]